MNKIKYFYKVNGGVSRARNYAFDKLSGSYVVFLDSDNLLDKKYLELTLNKIKSEPKKAYIYTQLKSRD